MESTKPFAECGLRLDNGSRVSCEVQARFCKGPRGRFPRSTHLYKGCERICERVAVTLDGGLPRGKRWHQVLLGRMREPGGRGRPILFGDSLLLELDEYRRFRHRVQHIYGYELEAERVLTLAWGVKSILERVKAAVAAFNVWLEAQVGRGDQG